jgi:hypothetical protein
MTRIGIDIILLRPAGTREPISAEDWGDDETIGLQLKRRGMKGLGGDKDFGVFLGGTKVGIKNFDFSVKEILTYDSVEAMKQEWILD